MFEHIAIVCFLGLIVAVALMCIENYPEVFWRAVGIVWLIMAAIGFGFIVTRLIEWSM